MFDYLQENERRVAVEAAYQVVRRLFESLAPTEPSGEEDLGSLRSGPTRRTVKDTTSLLTDRILRDIEVTESRSIAELDRDRIGFYTDLLTSRTENLFPRAAAGGSERAREVLSKIRSARPSL